MTVRINENQIDPWLAIHDYQAQNVSQFGATSIFIGTMRDFNEGETVQGMTLAHYPGMTERQLEKILSDAGQKWRIVDNLILHRVGDISPNETIVVVAVWAIHRGDAIDACRFIIEQLKSAAPFWKKEWLAQGGSRWIEKNTDGYAS